MRNAFLLLNCQAVAWLHFNSCFWQSFLLQLLPSAPLAGSLYQCLFIILPLLLFLFILFPFLLTWPWKAFHSFSSRLAGNQCWEHNFVSYAHKGHFQLEATEVTHPLQTPLPSVHVKQFHRDQAVLRTVKILETSNGIFSQISTLHIIYALLKISCIPISDCREWYVYW